MLLKELYNKNEKNLLRALRIKNLLKQALENGMSLTDDIINCNNAYVYYTSTASLTAQAKAPMGEKFLCNLLGYTKISPR